MKIIIIGCGRVGSGLAKQLSLQGIDVSVIDNDPEILPRQDSAVTSEESFRRQVP